MTMVIKSKFLIFLLISALIANCFLPCSALNKSYQAREFGDENYRLQPYDEVTLIHFDKSGNTMIFDKIQVLPNGHLSLPFLGEVKASDRTVEELKKSFNAEEPGTYDLFINYHQRHHVTVIGEVKSPGSYSVKDLMSIYDAIGTAGGFNSVADKRKVKIIRQYRDGKREEYLIDFPKEIFNAYEDGIGQDRYAVKEDDIIYVPRSLIKASGKVALNVLNYATLGLITAFITVGLD